MRPKRWFAAVAAFVGSSLSSGMAVAAVPNQPTCGVTVSGSLVADIPYDPFSGSSSVVSLPFNLRLDPWTGAQQARKTQTVNFIFVRPAGSPDIQILYNGVNVVYESPNYQGHPQINSQATGEVYYNFGGQSEPVNFPGNSFVITIPAFSNITAGQNIPIDIRYVCNGTGGLPDVTTPTTVPSGATINIRVLSGLQASFVGPDLAFGEVGDRTDTDVAAPAVGSRTGNVRVASSGPFNVQLESANAYRMTYLGGDAATETQNLRYRLTFLNQERMAGDTTPISFNTCERAGLGSPPLSAGRNLPITVQLLEGGTDETPAQYRDELTVTVSPVVAPPYGTPCGTIP